MIAADELYAEETVSLPDWCGPIAAPTFDRETVRAQIDDLRRYAREGMTFGSYDARHGSQVALSYLDLLAQRLGFDPTPGASCER